MNIPENREALQHLVIQYLYGDLSDVEVRQFEAEIESNTVLRDLLEEEQRFDTNMLN